MANWLPQANVPLFVSRSVFAKRKSYPRAACEWALDSNGFTQVAMHGGWLTSPRDFAASVRRIRDEVGLMAWASPQDWMCEPIALKATGKTVIEHQRLTIENYLELRSIDPELPWVPVLQGWQASDYLEHVGQYIRAGVDLMGEPLVGLGTVCRRQATDEAAEIIKSLRWLGIRLHGFGLKKLGLRRIASYLVSSDSLAWSFEARRKQRAECGSLTHKNCANCLWYALRWRQQLLGSQCHF